MRRILLYSVFCILQSAICNSEDWPQWRGPHGDGVSSARNLTTEWSGTQNVEWKTAIPGHGHSSPVVWGDRIFLTTAVEGAVVPGRVAAPKHKLEGEDFAHPDAMGADRRHTLYALSLDAVSGKILWQRAAYEGPVSDSRHRRASFASLTPVTDGKTVYFYFGSEGLYAYDFSGKLRWKYSPGNLSTLGVGYGASPVLFENLVILQCDENEGHHSFIVGVDKRSGREVWRTPRRVSLSWSTPLLVRSGNRTEVIASGNEWVIAYDPGTGKELWRSDGLKSNAVATPLGGNGMVYVSAGNPEKRTLALKLGGSGNVSETGLAWKYEKGTAYVASNILYDGLLYLIADKGILSCLDARTGDVKYDSGRPPVAGRFSASPVAFDDKILITSEDGDTVVVKAGPKFEVLRTNSLGEGVFASPAIARDRIYIRGLQHLYAIRKP